LKNKLLIEILIEKILNLFAKNVIDKLKVLVKKKSICFFYTQLNQQPLSTKPMSTQKVGDDENIWFMSSIKCDKNIEVVKNNEV